MYKSVPIRNSPAEPSSCHHSKAVYTCASSAAPSKPHLMYRCMITSRMSTLLRIWPSGASTRTFWTWARPVQLYLPSSFESNLTDLVHPCSIAKKANWCLLRNSNSRTLATKSCNWGRNLCLIPNLRALQIWLGPISTESTSIGESHRTTLRMTLTFHTSRCLRRQKNRWRCKCLYLL